MTAVVSDSTPPARPVSKVQLVVAVVIGIGGPMALGRYAERITPMHATVCRIGLFCASIPLGAVVGMIAVAKIRLLLPRGSARTLGHVFACLYCWYAGYAVLDAVNVGFDGPLTESTVRWLDYDRPIRRDPQVTVSAPEDTHDSISFVDLWAGGAIGARVRPGTPVRILHGRGGLGFTWVREVSGYQTGVR